MPSTDDLRPDSLESQGLPPERNGSREISDVSETVGLRCNQELEREEAIYLRRHEANESCENCANSPARLPGFLMEGGHGQANASSTFEATVRSQEDNFWGLFKYWQK